MPIKGHGRLAFDVALSASERDLVEAIAQRHGISIDEAAARLVSDALARRVRRRTGKSPARVFPLRKK